MKVPKNYGSDELFRKTEAYNRSLIEASLDPLVTINPNGTISDVNAATVKVTGYSREELIGTNFSDYFTDPDRAKEGYETVFGDGSVRDYELEIRHKNGQITPVLYNTTVYRDEAGNIAGVFAAARDITERKMTEQALHLSEQRLNRSQEIAHLGSWELDLSGNLLTWSDEVYRIFGLEPQEFGASYEAFLDSVHPDDRAAVDVAYSGSVREGKDGYEIEHRVVRRNTGEVRYVHEKCEHIRDGTGKIVRSVGMVHDITDRKIAEEENLHARREWERTFNSVPDPIMILDTENRIVRVNRAMKERLRTVPGELIGQHCYTVVHGTQCPPDFCPHRLTCQDGQQHVAEISEPNLGGDFLVSTTPLFDNEGKVEGIVHVARDITKRKRTEMELERHAERLKLSNQDLERFAYVASHDLREPLRMVTSFAQLLSERYKGKLDPDADEFIEYIVDGATRMDALVNDLLDYSRVTSRIKPMEMTDMNEPVDQALKNLSVLIKERNAKISVGRLTQAMVDQSQMTMVFQNLISNSIKFCREDVPEIAIGSFPQADEVVFSVRDNGIGIDPAYHQKIFEIFQRLHGRGEYSGTGIGLAICRRIVERHGGRIWVESEEGKGSTFFFTIPMEKNPEEGNSQLNGVTYNVSSSRIPSELTL